MVKHHYCEQHESRNAKKHIYEIVIMRYYENSTYIKGKMAKFRKDRLFPSNFGENQKWWKKLPRLSKGEKGNKW